MPDTKKFLDSAGLSTFLTNIKTAYAGNDTAPYSTSFTVALATKASQLATARTIALTGDVTGSVSFDGSADVTISTSIEADTNIIENVGVQTAASTTTWLSPATVDGHAKAVVVDLSGYALKSEVAAVMDYKGNKTGAQLAAMAAAGAASLDQNGDVYTCNEDGNGYVSGHEYVAVVTKDSGADTYTLAWTELGHTIDLSGYVTKTAKVNNKSFESGDITLNGSDIALSTSYAKASSSAAVAAGDSIDTAVGKLEKKVDDAISAATTYTFASSTTNGAFDVTPVVNGTTGTTQTVTITGLGSAAYADTTDFVSSTLTPAEAGAQVNVIEEIKVNGTTVAPSSKSVDITVPTAATSIAENAPGYATAGQVYSYVEANKGDENIIETIKVNGTALTPTSKAVDITAVTDVQTKTSTTGSFDSVVNNGIAQIDLSSYATTADIADFIKLNNLSTTDSASGDYVTGVSYGTTTGVFTVTKASKGAVADSDTGLVDGDTVYDYIDAMAMSTTEINALFPSA